MPKTVMICDPCKWYALHSYGTYCEKISGGRGIECAPLRPDWCPLRNASQLSEETKHIVREIIKLGFYYHKTSYRDSYDRFDMALMCAKTAVRAARGEPK